MPSQDDIEQKNELLATHRRTLAILLCQRAKQSAGHVTAEVENGITEARRGIEICKQSLRDWGQEVEDYRDDKAQPWPSDSHDDENRSQHNPEPIWNLRAHARKASAQQDWSEAERLWKVVLTIVSDDAEASEKHQIAHRKLDFQQSYAKLQELREEGQWQVALSFWNDLKRRHPRPSDPDGIHAWALEQRRVANQAPSLFLGTLRRGRWLPMVGSALLLFLVFIVIGLALGWWRFPMITSISYGSTIAPVVISPTASPSRLAIDGTAITPTPIPPSPTETPYPPNAAICQETVNAPTPAATTGTIAIFAPRTGEFNLKGKAMIRGACLAYADLHPDIGVVAYDDQGGNTAAQFAESIATDQSTLCVVGNYSSGAVMTAIPVYIKASGSAGPPMLILPAASEPKAIKGYPSAWRLVGTNNGQARAALLYIQQRFPSRRILLVHDDRGSYGQDLEKYFQDAGALVAPENDHEYLFKSLLPDTDGTSSPALMTLLEQLGIVQPTDVIFFAGDVTDFIPFIKAARKNGGITAPIIGTDGADSPALRALSKELDQQKLGEVYYVTMAAPPITTFDFPEKYLDHLDPTDAAEATTLALPDPADAIRAYAAESYDAMSLCIRAIRRAALPTRAAVQNAMKTMTNATVIPQGSTPET
jgi:ABC-type branched-subunit amino acid transport system substrate-binding protein